MTKFKGKALNLIVIIEEVFNENKTASGFDLSEVVSANEKQKRGKVVSVGEQCPKLSDGTFTLKEGDEIIFDKHKMTPFTQDGVGYILIDYRDIVIVF
jgi:co-chaperonin GroES (HSP10)